MSYTYHQNSPRIVEVKLSTVRQKSPLTIHCHLMKKRHCQTVINCHKLSAQPYVENTSKSELRMRLAINNTYPLLLQLLYVFST